MSAVLSESRPCTRRVLLSEAVEINPKTDRSELVDDTPVSFVPMAAVGAANGRIDVSTVRPYREVKKGYTHFRDGDVLFAKVTPCMENGKMAVARHLEGGLGFGSTEFHVLRPRDGVDAHYVYHYVSSETFRKEAARHMTGAVGLRRVPTAFLEEAEIPLPEIDVQRRAVDEIEKQFSRLDEAVANLQRVKANLKRHRSSVLQAVTSGRLSTDSGSNPGIKDWRWLTIADLASAEPRSIQSGPFGSNLLHSEFQATGKLVIGIDNVHDGAFSMGSNHRISEVKFQELAKYAARPRDVLITVMATVGRVCVLPETIEPAIITKHVYRITIDQELAIPEYVGIALRGSREVRMQLRASVRGQTRPGLNGSLIKRIRVPVPPLERQSDIVAEVDRRLSIVREVEAEVDANLKRAQALRQAVLAKAFSGAPA